METRTAVALKLEHIDAWPSMLRNELHVYRSLAGQPGIPSVHWEGEECEYRVMVLDLLGPSLEDLLTFCGGRFSLKTTLMLADQLIHRFQRIHSKGFVHRDIKADQFLMGRGKQGNQVYVVDMGVAIEIPEVDFSQNPTRPQSGRLAGTAYFASVNAHLGIGKSLFHDKLASGGNKPERENLTYVANTSFRGDTTRRYGSHWISPHILSSRHPSLARRT